jgi:hypothetical protein
VESPKGRQTWAYIWKITLKDLEEIEYESVN